MDVGQSVYAPRKPDMGNPYKLMQRLDANEDGRLSKGEIEETKLARVIGDNFAKVDTNEDGGISSDELFEFREAQREDRRGPSQREAVTAALVATLTELTETLSDLVEQQFGTEEGTVIEGEAVVVEPEEAPIAADILTEAALAAAEQALEETGGGEFADVEVAAAEDIAAAELAALEDAAEASQAEQIDLGAAATLSDAARNGLSSQDIVLSLFQSIIEAVGDEGDRAEAPELAQSLYSEMQSLLGDAA